MKLSIVLSTQPARFEAVAFKGQFVENVARIAALGYNGVELAVRDPALVNQDELARVVAAHGLVVPAIGTGQAWGEEGLSLTDPSPEIRTAAIARIKAHVPLARRFQAVIIIGLLRGLVKPGVTQEQAMEWLVAGLRECCSAAEDAGVKLVVEPVNRYETTLINTAASGLELIRHVSAGNLGLLLDTFHMNIEEPAIEESIRQVGPHIYHFHVADSNRWHPGAGHLDFHSILDVLMATGYQGFVSGEFMPKPDPETAAARSIAHLRSLFPDQNSG